MTDEPERPRVVPAGEFKARCLRLMDQVGRNRVPVIITKHGRPVAKLSPLDDQAPPLFGCLKGTVTIVGDIIAPIDVVWTAAADDDEYLAGP